MPRVVSLEEVVIRTSCRFLRVDGREVPFICVVPLGTHLTIVTHLEFRVVSVVELRLQVLR